MQTHPSTYSISSPLLFIFTFFSLSINPVHGNAELRALMDIKTSLDPENNYLSSWTSDGDPCSGSFEGVACNEHRKVANISMQGKGLTGKLPPAVAELKCLSGLYLHYNSLTGDIPMEIANLTELTDLYLNVNNFSGIIPPEIGSMASLQVLQLCCNRLIGIIPSEVGLLKKLNVLALERNQLSGRIPASLGNMGMLKRLYLNSNKLSGPIPVELANLPELEVLDVQNNTLSGFVPFSLRRLNEGFHFGDNPGLCGAGFSSLRACSSWDNSNINQVAPFAPVTNKTATESVPQPAIVPLSCNQTHCSKSSTKLPQMGIVFGVVVFIVMLLVVAFLWIVWCRRGKQKVGDKSDTSHDRISNNQGTGFYETSPSPLVSLEPHDCNGMCHEFNQGYKFNLEEVESATQHFSEVNILGKSKFSAVYKGILKDGSIVAVKSISKTSCKTEENGFMKGLSLLNSLKHENLVKLRGFCCSKGRGECFLIYDFVSNGNLSRYLDPEHGRNDILDWPTRVQIINGIAKGVEYLHRNEANKPPIVHQNISVRKVLIDQLMNPLILDSGLLKLLADDVVYSAIKESAALGYMAPEYITTGRFTEKSDVYAFGVIILQVLSGKRKLLSSTRMAAESGKLEEFIDSNLKEEFSETEAAQLTRIALNCTNELPQDRPSMERLDLQSSSDSGGEN
ncbi:leucine-rich repeat receptor protein kinase EXS-like [Dorcoceras hygrometricum]|uniref:Leucine-rich repeat receptor protein kinase EXS-like n=1 Tax=Dorcoceras hygrometricum TaxID=472368 RepID=A0A2Z7C8I5_9LAMI|nr:leucine-rich repeat receptor protein kinase EXS-like [Dorcoceras hygrometricum]